MIPRAVWFVSIIHRRRRRLADGVGVNVWMSWANEMCASNAVLYSGWQYDMRYRRFDDATRSHVLLIRMPSVGLQQR